MTDTHKPTKRTAMLIDPALPGHAAIVIAWLVCITVMGILGQGTLIGIAAMVVLALAPGVFLGMIALRSDDQRDP